ncbi:MAG: hypothetical protein ACPGRX_01070 [Bdellovibrionales bacterium]
MSEKTKPKLPDVYLATQDQVEVRMAKQRAETKDWLDRVIDRQNEALMQQMERMDRANKEYTDRIDTQTRWVVGLLIALLAAVLTGMFTLIGKI